MYKGIPSFFPFFPLPIQWRKQVDLKERGKIVELDKLLHRFDTQVLVIVVTLN
jgi:hypothetical protein